MARLYSGTTDTAISVREIQNRLVARKAATEGIVLLKNDGVLPIAPPCKIALFGAGARRTVKGGTGSGDVNPRDVVSFEQGLLDAGYQIAGTDWLNDYDRTFRQARRKWTRIFIGNVPGKDKTQLINFYLENQFQIPDGRLVTARDVETAAADVAIYVIARLSGEGADRQDCKGDFRLTDNEFANLKLISESYSNTVVVINAGGIIDLSFIDQLPRINSLIYALQPGMDGGHALAAVVSGAVSPSGKLTDSWAFRYADYSTASHFSNNDGNVAEEYYKEDIFVGYRYFDSFKIKPRYEFGYGMSYTDFAIRVEDYSTRGLEANLNVSVINSGSRYGGKEVVQIYVTAPQGRLVKADQVLAGFSKTRELSPSECQTLTFKINISDYSSYDAATSKWILEPGVYSIRVGNSSRKTVFAGQIELDQEIVTGTASAICPVQKPFDRLLPAGGKQMVGGESSQVKMPVSGTAGNAIESSDKWEKAAKEIVVKMSLQEIATAVCGESGDSGQSVGNAASSVPGAAGETSSHLFERYGLNSIVLADGPAGLRIAPSYLVNARGKAESPNLMLSVLEPGPILKWLLGLVGLSEKKAGKGKRYYQYCTAMPIGTLLAQTWDLQLIEEIGHTVGQEMTEFGITLWLAPGMNIHRDPLCGRNYEYFSEDPLLTGKVAAALTRGVQSRPGLGTTLKHFACNNQETNRYFTDSILSEQALREIYLKGFEIAIKEASPMAVMTSYNLINGIRTANSKDLCTQVLRNEWGFQGVVMTDWLATSNEMSSVTGCIDAGNDLIMPGEPGEVEQLIKNVQEGKLEADKLRISATRVVKVILIGTSVKEESH